MKQILLSVVIAISATIGATAQSLTIPSLDLNPWGAIDVSIIQDQGTVENTNGTMPIDVKVKRITVDTVPGTLNYFCWEQCYEPQVSESPTSMNIPVGQRINQFYADYKPQGNAGVSTLVYCFYDVTNEADSVCATVRFSASPVGIEDVFMGDASGISESYPNPANTIASVNYALNQGWQKANVEVYSMLGSKVKAIDLKEDQGTLKMDVSTLPAGMYFYTLTVDGNSISTKKMLVTK